MRLLHIAIYDVLLTGVATFAPLYFFAGLALGWAVLAGAGMTVGMCISWAIVRAARKRAGIDPPL